ncbi:MAG: hypothetical protein ACRDXE_10130 [Acidimicrobiales bacterium]
MAEVNVIDPSISGKVESMRGSVLIIQDQDGFYRTINLTGSTTYTNAGKSADATALVTSTGTGRCAGSQRGSHAQRTPANRYAPIRA